jgi:tetratricopeptide (TPR) repeat protein
VSCLAEQAKILWEEAKKMGDKARSERWNRWYSCDLCKQRYHGVVRCALGWACWKTYVGRPETADPYLMAMSLLGSGLYAADHYEDALSVRETELAMERRVGASERNILAMQSNLANTYQALGRLEHANRMLQEVYSGTLKLNGKQHKETLGAATNYANSLKNLERFELAKALLRKTLPIARRVLGENDDITRKMRRNYAQSLYLNPGATLDDLREAVTTLEDTDRIARRVMGGGHPLTLDLQDCLRNARATLRTRETPSGSA